MREGAEQRLNFRIWLLLISARFSQLPTKGSQNFALFLTRAKLEGELPMILRNVNHQFLDALREGNMYFDKIIMIGGADKDASRPFSELVTTITARDQISAPDPMEAVAIGATIQAARFDQPHFHRSARRHTPHNLGIEEMGMAHTIIDRNDYNSYKTKARTEIKIHVRYKVKSPWRLHVFPLDFYCQGFLVLQEPKFGSYI